MPVVTHQRRLIEDSSTIILYVFYMLLHTRKLKSINAYDKIRVEIRNQSTTKQSDKWLHFCLMWIMVNDGDDVSHPTNGYYRRYKRDLCTQAIDQIRKSIIYISIDSYALRITKKKKKTTMIESFAQVHKLIGFSLEHCFCWANVSHNAAKICIWCELWPNGVEEPEDLLFSSCQNEILSHF